MRQGRWNSSCFEMYIHLHASVVRETFRRVANEAMLTTSELSAAADRQQQSLLAKWKHEFLHAQVDPLWCGGRPDIEAVDNS